MGHVYSLQKFLLFLAFAVISGSANLARAQVADSFDPNADGQVRVVVVQPNNGKILIGGYFGTLAPNGGDPVPRSFIARVNSDGTLDTGFDPNPNGPIRTIVVQSNGKILIG
jgi:hypothetical protein